VWLGTNCTADRGVGKARGRERADQKEGGRTFVLDRNVLNDRLAIPLADIEGRSHYGRMEPESKLILLPPSFGHVDPDHLCRLIGVSPLLSRHAFSAWQADPTAQRTCCND
jgi:hypothetical protein